MKKPPLTIVARIVSPFGRRGEVKALLETDFPDQFASRKKLMLSKNDLSGDEIGVEQIRFHKGAALVKLEGVDSINDAEELRGSYLAISSDERTELPEDSFWLDDIVGLEVVLEDGQSLGRIREVLRTGSNDVWVTPRAMIPAIKDVVVRVDVEAGVATIRAIEGLEIQDE